MAPPGVLRIGKLMAYTRQQGFRKTFPFELLDLNDSPFIVDHCTLWTVTITSLPCHSFLFNTNFTTSRHSAPTESIHHVTLKCQIIFHGFTGPHKLIRIKLKLLPFSRNVSGCSAVKSSIKSSCKMYFRMDHPTN